MQEREGSESISSDGELEDFKKYKLLNHDDKIFVDKVYMELIKEKYKDDSKQMGMYISGRCKDEEIYD